MNIISSIVSTSFLIIIYLIKENICLTQLIFPKLNPVVSLILSSILYVIIIFFCSGINLFLCKKTKKENLTIESIDYADNSFLPTYIGYFFVGLSLPEHNAFGFTLLFIIYITLLIFISFTRTASYNPFFLLYGYRFYNITKADGTKLFLISRKKYNGFNVSTPIQVKRINDFTFIENN